MAILEALRRLKAMWHPDAYISASDNADSRAAEQHIACIEAAPGQNAGHDSIIAEAFWQMLLFSLKGARRPGQVFRFLCSVEVAPGGFHIP